MNDHNQIVRLSPHVYNQFAAQFKPLHPTEQTSALQAGYYLGVEAVLKKLREQIVVDAGPL
jgi:hypothetical protein